jgi:signal transduction histidine kinase
MLFFSPATCSKVQLPIGVRQMHPYSLSRYDIYMLVNTDMDTSRHKCLLYDGHPSEQLPVVIPFLADGLRTNWRCLYIGSPDLLGMVSTALEVEGIDPAHEVKRRSLILTSDRSHLVDGNFDPQVMIELLCGLIDAAVQDGFEGLCATGDMRWELGKNENFDHLLEYEARLDQLFREKPLRGICQYHRDLLPGEAIHDAVITHQTLYVGEALTRENVFYVPPELLFENGKTALRSKRGEWLSQQIIRILKAEEKRDQALKALQASEAHQRRLAEQLAEINSNLEKRVRERTAELELANKHLEAFSYSVSHDLRGPLQSITGFTEILADECGTVLSEKAREHLHRVQTSAHRMAELIEGLLTFYGVVKANLERLPIDLTATAEEILRELREIQPERTVECVISTGMRAVGDPVLIRSVLANLIGNAWKFTSKRSNGRIEVGQTSNKSGQRAFFVKDNGAGFDMQNAPKLFQAFQRLHSKNEFPGSGIGLATVQRIVTKHGGRIWAESSPNNGATFFFTLPADT